MDTTSVLADRLTKYSQNRVWDPHTTFEWPEQLTEGAWCMSPELISIYGTDAYEALDEAQRKKLALYEVGNFFSLVLQGERPLVQGLIHRLYSKYNTPSVTAYLHHFVDEENKHMMMFGEFCRRYVGKVYPEKKMVLPREYAKGEEDIAFYCKVMVVEELGDYYNAVMARDESVDPFVRRVNRVHMMDEARHLAFGRQFLAEMFEKFRKEWSVETLAGFRSWLSEYLRSSWSDYYNPSMYRDAGLADGYELRQMALRHPACTEHRRKASAKLVKYFLDVGLLEAEPSFVFSAA
jgi:hypothetical protein